MCRQSTAAAKLCMLFSAAVLPGSGFAELGKNYVFMAGFWGWFFAQGCKVQIAHSMLLPSRTACLTAHSCSLLADLQQEVA